MLTQPTITFQIHTRKIYLFFYQKLDVKHKVNGLKVFTPSKLVTSLRGTVPISFGSNINMF